MHPLLFLALFLFQATAQVGTPQEHLEAVQQKLRQFTESMIPELLAQADRDADPAVRRAILSRLSRVHSPEVRAALARHAAEDPDAKVALMALDRLRIQQDAELGMLFEKRLALARSQNDSRGLEALVAENQRWVTIARGAILPGFMRQPPPVFAAAPERKSVRVVAFGDSGQASPAQREVAAAVAAYHKKKPFDLGLTLGDNFEPDGVTGLDDPRWKAEWEDIYSDPGIPFYASTGNHDWGFADSPASEIYYSHRSKSWRMPALYYSFTAGPAQFFSIATQAMSEAQLQWLKNELERSSAKWKIVYGHHPIYSYGTHGETVPLKEALLPVLRNRADIYLVGHEHLVQYLKPDEGVHFFVAAAAGQRARPIQSGPRTLFADSFYGFTVMDISAETLRVTFVDTDGKIRFTTDIKK